MATDEETTEYNLRLDAAQMLQAIAEVNSNAASIPEALNNINLALDQFSKKYGISLAASQKEMAATISDAERLRKVLENPIAAPTVILNPNAATLAQTPNPFEQMGMSTRGGLQALNDQREQASILAKQEARSEADVAKEINKSTAEEERKAAALRNILELEREEKRLMEEAAAIRAAEAAQRQQQKQQAEANPVNPANYPGMNVDRDAEAATMRLNDEIRKAGDRKKAYIPSQEEYNKAVNDGIEAQQKLADKMMQSGEAGKKGAQKATLATRAWSIAVGMLIHQGINLLINALQQMFTMAISGLRELETATYNLVNAERTLSEQGVEITPKGLDETIKKLKEIDPLLSKNQATEVVSRVSSLVAPNVGFDAKEIEQFSQAVAVLAVKNRGLGKSFEEVESQMSNAFLSGKVSVGINQLGVKITDQIVKDEALRLGLVRNADEFDKLTGKVEANVKARAMLSVVVNSTQKDMKYLPEFFNNVDAKIGIFQAKLQDLFTQLGTNLAPLFVRVLDFLIEALEKASAWLDENRDSVLLFADVLGNVLVIVMKLTGAVMKFGMAGISAFKGMLEGVQKLIDKIPFLKQLAQLLGFKGIGDMPDTPTGKSGTTGGGAVSPYGAGYAEAVAKAEAEVTEIMKDARQKREDLQRDHANKMADLSRDLGRKLSDIARSLRDKLEDAQRDYSDKVATINSDTDKKIAETKQESYKKSIEAEQKYQDELKSLRDKYLMDLEEALRARDAHQILRLMKQYALDKEKAVEGRDKEREQAKSESQQKLRDLETERKEKLAAAAKDLADKIKQAQLAAARERRDAAIAHQRVLADARQAYQRQLNDQRLFLQRKLQDLAASIAKEYELTAAGRARINALIGSASSPASVNAGTYQAPGSSVYTGSTPIVSSTWAQAGLYGTGGLAEGGTFLATRPATINVAENRPEMITATPLGKPGRDISKVFTNGGGGMGGSGQIEIAMTLSPDLEARIVSNTLNETANIVTRINRSKS